MHPPRLALRVALRAMLCFGALLLCCAVPARVFAQAGLLDPDFLPTIDGTVTSIALQGDKIIICGEFTNVNGSPLNRIARLETDGTLDPPSSPATPPTAKSIPSPSSPMAASSSAAISPSTTARRATASPCSNPTARSTPPSPPAPA